MLKLGILDFDTSHVVEFTKRLNHKQIAEDQWVDGTLIESQEGAPHWERARPFLEAGLPCFIDKPFTCSVADARKIVELADKHKVPIFSSSSLRYAPELVEFMADSKK